jgi:hypothetical protein
MASASLPRNRRSSPRRRLALTTLTLLVLLPGPTRSDAGPDWVSRSNEHAGLLLRVLARTNPEYATKLGVEAADTRIRDLSPGFVERNTEALEAAAAALDERLAAATDPRVRQDIRILRASVDESLEGIRLRREHLLPFVDVAEVVYGGIRGLLEDRVAPQRRETARARLARYAGSNDEQQAFAVLAEDHIRREWQAPGERLPPFRGEVERSLATSERYLDEIGRLLERYGLDGAHADLAALRAQVAAYEAFVRDFVLPRAREDFRLPAPVYAFRLREHGVDMPVDELRRRGAAAFAELQNQLSALARRIAAARGLPDDDYRAVLRALKDEQLDGEAILPLYEQRVATLEDIIRREGIVSLPARPMRIRLATEAESARAPAPFMSPPRLIGNTGEHGELVLPLRLVGGDGAAAQIDDFTHAAAAWPLAAHEGRPGHELQFSRMIEQGVSVARAVFARNDVNVEGWALYMEEQVLPHLPPEGRFMTLWSRAVRAARAVLDPALNAGDMTPEQARRILRDELLLSAPLADSELERYRFRAPGQAASYFNGYLRMMELRAEAEWRLGDAFDRQAFHDFILEQGLLPPALLREAVLETFIADRPAT